MKVLLLSMIVLLGFTFASAKVPEQIKLKAGQQKTAKTGRINIKFLELIEDSRCPADVNCVWAGIARIKVRLTRNGKAAEVELNTNHKDKPAIFQGYSIGLTALTPYPTTTSKYSQSAYTATLTVSKAS
jgi:hypothetical protein